MGLIDIVIESGLHPYDVQALMPIVAEAGGTMTTWEGGRADDGGRIVACGDLALHADVLRLLAASPG
jgi:myo-inositol-1(or 4)-monophosphatase